MHRQGPQRERPGYRQPQQRRIIWQPPKGYPSYFDKEDKKHVLLVEYVTTYADQIAQQFGEDGLSKNQLQDFYRFTKDQQQALQHGRSFSEVLVRLKKLKAIAHDRRNRRNSGVTESFKQFIDKNVDALSVAGGKETFEKGFLEHFQAVVAYCAGRLKEGGR